MEILQLREQLENARLALAVKTEVSDGVCSVTKAASKLRRH